MDSITKMPGGFTLRAFCVGKLLDGDLHGVGLHGVSGCVSDDALVHLFSAGCIDRKTELIGIVTAQISQVPGLAAILRELPPSGMCG